MSSQIKIKQAERGFTLIELLVVIAIIGILSSIVLVAIGGARDEAKDSRIISDMSQIRSLAEILYSSGSYSDITCSSVGTSCTCVNSEIEQLCEDIYTQNSSAGMVIRAGSGEYCVEVTLNNGNHFCIDSYGHVVEDTNANINCDTSDYDCDTSD